MNGRIPPRVIVDDNDLAIAIKERDDIDFGRDIYRVSALWVSDDRGRILLAQRGHALHNGPGLWGPSVSGTVDDGETYEYNIYKEADEELGIKDIKFEMLGKIFVDGHRRYFCTYYSAVIDDSYPFRLSPFEVADIKWMSRSQLTEFPHLYVDGMEQVVQRFLA